MGVTKQLSLAVLMMFLIGGLQLLTTSARCIPGARCDDIIQQMNYFYHINNISETITINNVSLNLRQAEGRTDQLGDFSDAQVCPWHYEADFNSSRLPQVMYTAHCDTETWCDPATGETYKCLPLDMYTVPIVTGTNCNLFSNTEWTMDFVNIAVSCYPSDTRMDSTEYCPHLS